MLINLAYRFELDPKQAQLSLLRQFAGTARFAYSWGLNKWQETYEASGKGLDAYKLSNIWTKERPEWADPRKGNISKCVAQSAFMNLEFAFKRFFKKQAKYPKPKKRSHGDSFKLDGAIRVNPHSIQLPRLGKIRTKQWIHLPKGVKITSATVKHEADRWFVSLTTTRDWTCPDCEATHDRDSNAAINLYNEGMRIMESTGGSPGNGVSRSQGGVATKTKDNEACGAVTLPTKKAGNSYV